MIDCLETGLHQNRRAQLKRILREPVFQFLILACAIFAYFNFAQEDRPAETEVDQIVIAENDLRVLIEQHKSIWNRSPTQDELNALIERTIHEEVMMREAIALGLDRGDAVIRARLNQKMQFFSDSAVQMLEPDDTILQAFMESNPAAYIAPAKVTFEQIFLGDSIDEQDVQQALELLASGASPASLGRRGLLPKSLSQASEQNTDGTFGNGFFAQVANTKIGVWAGPVRSGFGWHLVNVAQYAPEQLPPFNQVRDKVLADWRNEQRQIVSKAQYAKFLAGYDIVKPTAATLQAVLSE